MKNMPDKSQYDKLTLDVSKTREEMGAKAANHVARIIKYLLESKQSVNMIFAAAPSQDEFLEALLQLDIAWERINAFHMDEYIGIAPDAPQSFGQWLKVRLFDRVPFQSVHLINPLHPEQECERYKALLRNFPPDICCLGIGENGHLAFNDPPVADFNDPKWVKIVELEQACRQQQVNDGCFESLSHVPKTAITLTIPALLSATYMSCVVPGSNKAKAVKNSLEGEISTTCPASILRTHKNAALFVDSDAYNEAW